MILLGNCQKKGIREMILMLIESVRYCSKCFSDRFSPQSSPQDHMSRNKTETFLSAHFIEDQKNVIVMIMIVILITSIIIISGCHNLQRML